MEETSLPLKAFQERLGYTFDQVETLERAITHPSFLQQSSETKVHNQRLEFLGDAVLGLILAEQLFASLPSKREGVLTMSRSALAKGPVLAQLARELGLPEVLRISDAEERNHGRQRDSILEDAFEAVIGAIYLDSDYLTVKAIVLGWYGDIHQRLEKLLNSHNPKGKLQEYLQPKIPNEAISYNLVAETGPDHKKRFSVELRVNDVIWGLGEGHSKKEAEEEAARDAISQYEDGLLSVDS